MLALQFKQSVPRFVWLRLVSKISTRAVTWPGGFLGLADIPEPPLPTSAWVRLSPLLSGICGSDIAAITGTGSIYLSALTSFPFVPGHELVGRITETGSGVKSAKVGDRIVVEPALGCQVRGFEQPCLPCSDGHYANCERVLQGDIASGVQTGYCRDTGGGWGSSLVVHESQLHQVPENISDEAAVLTEPFSCALHAVLQARIPNAANVLVVGSGIIGLLTIAALRVLHPSITIVATVRHQHQGEAALALGADQLVAAKHGSYIELADFTGARIHPLPMGKPVVVGGFDISFDCVGSATSLEDAVRWTRAQGQVVLVGMPGPMHMDLAPLWYQEVQLLGTYAYGLEHYEGRHLKTFDLALEFLTGGGLADRLEKLVRHRFSLKSYRQAINTAMHPAKFGAIKTVFDLRNIHQTD